MKNFTLFLALALLMEISSCTKIYKSPEELFQDNPDIQVDTMIVKTDSMYRKGYLLRIKQQVDHYNPKKGYFMQRVWLSDLSPDAPMVMVTEGYSADRNYTTEIAKYLKANQAIVEHRYFGESVPDSMNWSKLTVLQAALDHHHIIELLKKYYKGRWLTTGISKGGQTTIFHRALFPDDVDVSVPYVAPFNMDKEDPRLLTFFEKAGTPESRQKMQAFQRELLRRKPEMLAILDTMAQHKNWEFSMGKEKAFELTVLEYPFSAWQWGYQDAAIPDTTATTTDLFNALYPASDFYYFTDKGRAAFVPFFYQAYAELGYYSYYTKPFRGLLQTFSGDTVSNSFLSPVENPKFDKQTVINLLERLHKYDPKMILLVGENDPWAATSLDPTGFKNLMKIVNPGGSHKTRIENLPEDMRTQVLDSLKTWMNVKKQ
jgi:hypothetical protein